MKYKVGDKVRVRGDLEVGKQYGNNVFVEGMKKYKGEVAEIEEEACSGYRLGDFGYRWASEMLRPAEFKIWCETEEEKQAVLEELEKEGYVWSNDLKPTKFTIERNKIALYIRENKITWDDRREFFINEEKPELTPSEFTGIDFSEKIIITKTPTGVTASYGDKTVTTDGDFDDASRQALAEVLCPFEVGDEVRSKILRIHGKIEKIQINGKITVRFSNGSLMNCFDYKLKPYTEPYNAKLFCIKGSGTFSKGHIYEVKDGKFTDEYLTRYEPYKDLEDVNNRSAAQFMEIKGGLDD